MYSGLATQALRKAFKHPRLGTTVLHYEAGLAEPENFNSRGQPDYLAPNPGIHATGIIYTPNPQNPLRGIFCQSPRRPYQDVGGIYYQAQMTLYLSENLGDIYVTGDRYPKRQDKFEIAGQTYYAIGPALPCQAGDDIFAWKIDLNLQRYPVKD